MCSYLRDKPRVCSVKDLGSNPSVATYCPWGLSLSELRLKWQDGSCLADSSETTSTTGEQGPACTPLVGRNLCSQPAQATGRQMARVPLTSSPVRLVKWGGAGGGGGGRKERRPQPGTILTGHLMNVPRGICIPSNRDNDARLPSRTRRWFTRSRQGSVTPSDQSRCSDFESLPIASKRLCFLLPPLVCLPRPLPSRSPSGHPPRPHLVPSAHTKEDPRRRYRNLRACLPLGAPPPGAARRCHLAAGDGTAPWCGPMTQRRRHLRITFPPSFQDQIRGLFPLRAGPVAVRPRGVERRIRERG